MNVRHAVQMSGMTSRKTCADSRPAVEAAEGGTPFLDEFGALPPTVQAMFLIFLETGQFSRLGSTTVRKSNARLIAATNRDLGAAIAGCWPR